MTAPALTQTAAPQLTLSDCRLSATLQTLLCDDLDRLEAIRVIRADGVLREEVRASLPMLERTITGAGASVVKEVLAPLVLAFDVGEKARFAAWWKVYYDALSDLPADALQAAAREYPTRADAEFFPKPGPFRALALKHAAKAYTAVGRARAVVRGA